MTNGHIHFSVSFVISVIASLGFKGRVWFGLCHFLVSAHVIFVQSSRQPAVFHFPYMNQQKVVNHCYILNGNLTFPHSKIFSALIMVCKLTSCDVES